MNPVLLTIDLQKDFPRLFTLRKPAAAFDESVRLLAGFLTHACIRVTALDAYQRDYDVIIARDCVDTYDAAHEKVTLAYLSRYVARVLSNDELFALLGPGAGAR